MDPDRLLFGLRDITHAMMDQGRQAAAASGLGLPAMMALRHIDAEPGIRHGDLAQRLHLTPGSLTPIVQQLATRRLVDRRQDATDGRIHHLHLTDAGTAFRRAVEAKLRGTVEAAFAGWTPGELEQFAAGLERLRATLAASAPA